MRVARAVCLGVCAALPGLWLALMLVTNQNPDGGWIALALAAVAWGLLAWRALAQSVTLTPDTLVIRNILATRQVPLADVTEVGFRRGLLTVTSARGAEAGERIAVGAVNLGSSRWSGRRGNADAIAEAITDAAGLPPLPPRGEIISRNWAWVMLLGAALCVGLGVYCGPLQSGNTGLPFALREAGAVLYAAGAAMLGLAFPIIRDHRRKRLRARGNVRSVAGTIRPPGAGGPAG
jgi:Bacterial PH domain